MNIQLHRPTPAAILAYARAFACISATGQNEPPINFTAIVNLLYQPQFSPKEVNFERDCKPYIFGLRKDLSRCVFIPSWARAGVRYTDSSTDLRRLDPRSWITHWLELYRHVFPDIKFNSEEDQIFTQMYVSLGEHEDDIRQLIDQGNLITEAPKIKRIAHT